MGSVLVALIRVYQLTLSRVLVAIFGPVCRFEPSCSKYAVLCIQGHGVLRGCLLSAKRLCRCHPFHPGGYDPPPSPTRRSARSTAHNVDSPTSSASAPGATETANLAVAVEDRAAWPVQTKNQGMHGRAE